MNNERKYRILQVHNYYQIPGGEDTVVENEKRLLEEHGHTVMQYTRHNKELKGFSGFRKLLLPFSTIFNLRTYREVRQILREQKIDVVHVHNTLNLISPAVYYAALKCNVPVVQTIHNFRLLCPGATFYRDGHICEDCVKKGLGCAIKHSCYRDSRVQTGVCVMNTWIHRLTGVYGKLNYICLTDFNREKLLQLRQIKPERVFVKPNFVNVGDIDVIPFEKREDQFIFVGRLDKLKGINILLEAWNQMEADAPKLIICGTGPMENWCKEYIVRNELTSVEMMGFVPNTEAKKLIANSKALILPTQWYEGFPMTIVEAYSVGTPVIGSDMGNVGSLIEDGITGCHVSHNNPNKLRESILEFWMTDSTAWGDVLAGFPKYSRLSNYYTLVDIYSKI